LSFGRVVSTAGVEALKFILEAGFIVGLYAEVTITVLVESNVRCAVASIAQKRAEAIIRSDFMLRF